jgi:hypothetical protein
VARLWGRIVWGLSSAFTRLRVNAMAVMMAGIFLPGSVIGCLLSDRHVTPCLARRAFRESYDVNACWCRCVQQGYEQASADCIDPSYSVGTPNQRHCRLRGSTFVPRVCLHEFISAQAAPRQSRTHIRSVCSTRNSNTHTLSPTRPSLPSPSTTTHHSPLTTHHSPLTTHHSPLTTHHSPLTTQHNGLHQPRKLRQPAQG